MSYEYKQDGNALTDPPVCVSWRVFSEMFDDETAPDDLTDYHLTNYQAVVLKLHGTWEANKAMAQANGELITALRKKIKKAKRALK
jgi:microcystin degradation protein MlrC